MRQNSSIKVVAFATAISRFTGFIRDMFIYAVFGTSAINSAFIIAFTVPNLFRRFMGEGALTSAVVPVLADAEANQGKRSAFELLNRILSRSGVVLITVAFLGVVGFSFINLFEGLEARWYMSADFGMWTFPYLIFVCLSAIVCVALNLQKRFASAALAQIWVNLSMVVALAAGVIFSQGDTRMYWVIGGVLVGGILQLILPSQALMREGWKPKADLSEDSRLSSLYKLFGPGLIGATVAQTNTVVSQLLAFGLNAGAVSVLFLANRLMQLPLGIFAIAVTTVTFPLIAKKAAEGDTEGFQKAYDNGSKLIYTLMIPAGIGLALLSEPILNALFKWGSFDAGSVAQTAPILAIYALGLPFYASAAFVTRGFHSQKDTVSPVRWSIITFIINLVLSLWLKDIWGAVGLVVANVVSTIVFALGQRIDFARKGFQPIMASAAIGKMLMASILMALGVVLFIHFLPDGRLFSFVKILGGAALGAIIYLGALFGLDRESFSRLSTLVKK